MREPWFWVHLLAQTGAGDGAPIAGRYPVVGFTKEPDQTLYATTGAVQATRAGQVLLLIDDGMAIHAVAQGRTIRCPEPVQRCTICFRDRRTRDDLPSPGELCNRARR